ncbi:MAG: branched-chain amino acid ABC transporter permease [Acidimicrobiales bacterium]
MKSLRVGLSVGAIATAVAVVLPFIGLHVPWILPGTIDVVNSTGTLETLALCFVFAGVAMGYDVMFGYTGLLSLGVVMHFAAGVYVFVIALTLWHWPVVGAVALSLVVGLALALVCGSIALRVSGIAFAMVTLALAQALYYLIEDNPHGLTGGDDGLAMTSTRLPSIMSGAVSNTRNLYWIALAFLVVTFFVVWMVTESSTGHVLVALRDNERRVEVLGLRPFGFKLAAYVISSLIAAVGGMVYVLLVGTAVPSAVAATSVTLSIVIMVVLGGAGSRWGAMAGGIIYIYLQQYLDKVAAEPSFTRLPGLLRVPLSQPQFLLGALFILFVIFVPGGIAGAAARVRFRRLRARATRTNVPTSIEA